MIQTAQIILVMFLAASCFPLIVLGLPFAPHMTFAAMRVLLAGMTLLLSAFFLGHPQPKNIRTWLMLAATGGATTLGFLGMFHASEFISPGIATVVANIQPLLAAVLASVFLKENLDTKGNIGLGLGFLGIVFITLPVLQSGADGKYVVGIGYIALSAIGITIGNILIRRIAKDIDALAGMGWQLIFGGLGLAGLAVLTEDVTAVTWNVPFMLSLAGLALPGTALAYWLWCRVLTETELSKANAYSFLTPVFGLAMGIIFYGEKIGWSAALGIGLVVLGIVMTAHNNDNFTEGERNATRS